MKNLLLTLSLFISFHAFAESTPKNSPTQDMYIVTITSQTATEKNISIMTGFEKRKLILDSIASLCDKKSLECALSDDEGMPLTKIQLKAKGTQENLNNLEKMIN